MHLLVHYQITITYVVLIKFGVSYIFHNFFVIFPRLKWNENFISMTYSEHLAGSVKSSQFDQTSPCSKLNACLFCAWVPFGLYHRNSNNIGYIEKLSITLNFSYIYGLKFILSYLDFI